MRVKRLHYRTVRRINGFLFVLPWVIGFLLFFLIPIITTLVFSFNNVSPAPQGGRQLDWVGLKNYYDMFKTVLSSNNQQYIRIFYEEFINIIINTPLIVIFSLFAALLLNMNYKGRSVVRTIFFLPIVLGLNVVLNLISVSTSSSYIDSQTQSQAFIQADIFENLLLNSGLPQSMVGFLSSSVSQIFMVMARSGVQILIFLAGLQSINKSLYEVAEIEGANKYEVFWKIILPMMSQLILFVTIYTIVDMFLISRITSEIYFYAFLRSRIGLSAAISIVYLLFVSGLIGIIWFILSKVVVRYD